MSLLKSEAIGRLTDDPTSRVVTIGTDSVPVCEFDIAINYGFSNNEKTEYVHCVAWRKLAEIIGQHTKKGRKIFVQGHQQTRNYDVVKDGVTFRQYKTEWVIDEFEFCDSPNQGAASTAAPATVSGSTPF